MRRHEGAPQPVRRALEPVIMARPAPREGVPCSNGLTCEGCRSGHGDTLFRLRLPIAIMSPPSSSRQSPITGWTTSTSHFSRAGETMVSSLRRTVRASPMTLS